MASTNWHPGKWNFWPDECRSSGAPGLPLDALGNLATKLLQHFVAIAFLINALDPRLGRSRSSSVSSFATMTTIFLYNNSVTTAARRVKFSYRVIFTASCETQSIACNQKVVIE